MSAEETRRWFVVLTGLGSHGGHEVRAPRCGIEGGALVFYDENGEILVAYAPHRWVSVIPQ